MQNDKTLGKSKIKIIAKIKKQLIIPSTGILTHCWLESKIAQSL